MTNYVITNTRTGKIIAEGSARMCMRKLNFSSISSFHSMVSHVKSGVNQKYSVEIIKTERKPENV